MVQEHTGLLNQLHIQWQSQTFYEQRVQWMHTQRKTEHGHKKQVEDCKKQTPVSCFPFVYMS